MIKDKLQQMFVNAINHHLRSEEGRNKIVFGQGITLTTPIEIVPMEDLIKHRQQVKSMIDSFSKNRLISELQRLEDLIIQRETTSDVGTSELNWRRNIIIQRLEELDVK